MRIVRVSAYGEADELMAAEVEHPIPGPGDASVEIEFVSVNFIDVYTRRGVYGHFETYKSTPPFTPVADWRRAK